MEFYDSTRQFLNNGMLPMLKVETNFIHDLFHIMQLLLQYK